MSSLLWKPIFFSYIYFVLFFLLNVLGKHLRTVRKSHAPDTQFRTQSLLLFGQQGNAVPRRLFYFLRSRLQDNVVYVTGQNQI